MKIFFTKKQFDKCLEEERAAYEYAKTKYNYYVAKIEFIQTLLGINLLEMDTEEIEKFFKYNPDFRHRDFCRGMSAGIDCIIDTLRNSGVAKKQTLEKLRWRAKQKIEEHISELND